MAAEHRRYKLHCNQSGRNLTTETAAKKLQINLLRGCYSGVGYMRTCCNEQTHEADEMRSKRRVGEKGGK